MDIGLLQYLKETTVVDNATIDSKQIQKVAKILVSSPDEAWNMLQENR